MKKISLLILSVVVCVTVIAQTAREKAESIAAVFHKEKHKDKMVTAKPDIRNDVSEYAGKYSIEGLNTYIVIKKITGNNLEAVMTDHNNTKLATLKNIQVDSGLLSAVIEHTGGKKESFTAAFITRTENGDTSRGIGINQLFSLSNGFVADKAFYKKLE